MSQVCEACQAPRVRHSPDPCLGLLPGVSFACCGHGYRGPCYLVLAGPGDAYDPTRRLCGTEAREWMLNHGGQPAPFHLTRIFPPERLNTPDNYPAWIDAEATG